MTPSHHDIHKPASLRDVARIAAVLTESPASYKPLHRAVGAALNHGLTLERLFALPLEELARLPEMTCSSMARMTQVIAGCAEERVDKMEQWIRELTEANVSVRTAWDEAYPRALRDNLGMYAPPLLFLVGDAKVLNQPGLGIVGTTEPAPRTVDIAGDCAGVAVEAGYAVVSGGAVGVDQIAQDSARLFNGGVLQVLPRGLRPPVDHGYEVIPNELTVTPYLPNEAWAPYRAIHRNDIIASFSQAICALEPRRNEGAARTARVALDQGKSAWVYPHTGSGSDELHKLGAQHLPVMADDSLDDERFQAQLANFPTPQPPPRMQGELF
ncbi:MAG: DNA-processing protein DprA [Candidatus Hydrogenedentota bacterium]